MVPRSKSIARGHAAESGNYSINSSYHARSHKRRAFPSILLHSPGPSFHVVSLAPSKIHSAYSPTSPVLAASRLSTLVFAPCCVAAGSRSSRAVGVLSASCVAFALCSMVLLLSWRVGLGLLFTTSVVVFAAAMAARTEKMKRLAFIFAVDCSRIKQVAEATVISGY